MLEFILKICLCVFLDTFFTLHFESALSSCLQFFVKMFNQPRSRSIEGQNGKSEKLKLIQCNGLRVFFLHWMKNGSAERSKKKRYALNENFRFFSV